MASACLLCSVTLTAVSILDIGSNRPLALEAMLSIQRATAAAVLLLLLACLHVYTTAAYHSRDLRVLTELLHTSIVLIMLLASSLFKHVLMTLQNIAPHALIPYTKFEPLCTH
jgi:hypothetical protein